MAFYQLQVLIAPFMECTIPFTTGYNLQPLVVGKRPLQKWQGLMASFKDRPCGCADVVITQLRMYPLVNVQNAIGRLPLSSLIYPWKIVIFHSYVNVYQRVCFFLLRERRVYTFNDHPSGFCTCSRTSQIGSGQQPYSATIVMDIHLVHHKFVVVPRKNSNTVVSVKFDHEIKDNQIFHTWNIPICPGTI